MKEQRKYIYNKEIINVARVWEEISEEFWNYKGLKQGCISSLTLFSIDDSGLEEEIKKVHVGGIKIEEEKFWILGWCNNRGREKERERGREGEGDKRTHEKRFWYLLKVEKKKIEKESKNGGEDAMETVENFTYLKKYNETS